jgi:hypothetical protein
MLAAMKHTLIAILALAACGCAAMKTGSTAPAASAGDPLAQLPGDYDNHAQVWQAVQDQAALVPAHVHQRIVAVPKTDDQWDWTLRMDRSKGQPLEATWRYVLRHLDDGRLLLTPQRALPAAQGSTDAQWATLAPCAMSGQEKDGVLQLAADVAACSAILPGLGGEGALLPLRLRVDGSVIDVATFADQARGAQAIERAARVRWFDGWTAINGAGPNAQADSKDWHLHRDLHLHDQGGTAAILWRDGKPSGYSLKLEQLDYRERGTEVLKLSLIRDSDGGTVAYAWANPAATQIGLNLGWLQTGLTVVAGR